MRGLIILAMLDRVWVASKFKFQMFIIYLLIHSPTGCREASMSGANREVRTEKSESEPEQIRNELQARDSRGGFC